MVNNLKKVNKHIQFTHETQIDNTINFLDLTINISNNKFNSIYTKNPLKLIRLFRMILTIHFHKNLFILTLFYIDLTCSLKQI